MLHHPPHVAVVFSSWFLLKNADADHIPHRHFSAHRQNGIVELL
jgi:hypothetical protein